MAISRLCKITFIFLALSLPSQASTSSHYGISSDRVLRAATRRSDMFRRSMRIERKFGAELSFIEMENWLDESTFASQVQISSEAPILILEEIEHHLHDVKCEQGSVKLHFVDTVSARDARQACSNEHGGFVITSHNGCNRDGERSVYSISDARLSNDEFSLELTVVKNEWKEAFSHFKIDFGHTTDGHMFRRHGDFYKIRKRQIPNQASMIVATITAAPVAVPSDTPDTKTDASFDLATQILSKTFSPSDFLSPIQNVLSVNELPLEAGCSNCSTFGSLVLTQGSFDIDLNNANVGDAANILGFIKGGFIELDATDLGAHVELFAKPKTSENFKLSLFELPIIGFTIPQFGKAGVTFNASLQASYQINGGIELNYGMDVTVPAKSTVKVDLSSLDKSGITGFDAPEIVVLPFMANITDIDIALGLTFQPTVQVGFDFLDGKLESELSVSMNLPSLAAKLSTKHNVDQNCNTLGNSTYNSTKDVEPRLGKLVLVEASVGIALEVAADFSVPFLPAHINNFQTAVTILSTAFTLPTACLAADHGFSSVTGISGYSSITSTTIAATAMATYESSSAGYALSAPGYMAPSAPYHTATVTGLFYEQSPSCTASTVTVYVTASECSTTSSVTPPPPPPPSSVAIYSSIYIPFPVTNSTSSTYGATGTGTVGTGVFGPSTAPSQFTGAAAPSVQVPMWVRLKVWHVYVMSLGLIAEVMMM